MSTFMNATVLITGGASGIGKLIARRAIDRKCKSLILWDINQTALNDAQRELSSSIPVHNYCIDITDTTLVQSLSRAVLTEIGPVDILINNAGIVVGKYFHEHSHEDIHRSLAINAEAQMHVTREFLPPMIKRRSGHIVNIASAAGMVGNPRMSAYAASKWALIGWSDSLRIELEKLNTNVTVTCVTPYYISTGMFEGVRSSMFIPITPPETAAKKIVRGIEQNKLYVRMPSIIYILQFVKGILPTRLFDLIVGRFLKVYATMDNFTGRR